MGIRAILLRARTRACAWAAVWAALLSMLQTAPANVRLDLGDLPPENRVGGFSATCEHGAGPLVAFVQYPRLENEPILAMTASGRLFWLSRDPLGEAADPLHNLYRFVGNNPLNAVDPLGLALYAFDGTWNNELRMKRPTNVSKLKNLYAGIVVYEKGVGVDWHTKYLGGATGAGGRNRINDAYDQLTNIYPTDQSIDIIGFSRGAAEARDFANRIADEGITLSSGQKVFPKIRFLGLFDTVASFGVPGNAVNLGYKLSIPKCVKHVRQATAADEKRGMFPLSSVISDPAHPNADPRIVEQSFRGAHSDVGGGYYDGDRSNFALLWMHDQAVSVGVPFGGLHLGDIGASKPIMHDERGWWGRWRNKPRAVYYYQNN